MNRKKIFNTGAHVLFCLFFVYWFSTNSFIRPYAVGQPYKEIICALMILLVIYVNYIKLVPYFTKRNYYKSYLLLAILLTGVISIAELLIVKRNIIICFEYSNFSSSEMNRFLLLYLFVIFLRNAGFYLFFIVLKLYQQTKADALLEKKEGLKDAGLILLPPLRGNPISINISFVSYFSHEKNITFIHNKLGTVTSIYSTLNNIQEYLGDFCLRINKENIITFTNIVYYNEKHVIVKGGKTNNNISLVYSKNDTQHILQTLRLKVPNLEEKNATYSNEKRIDTVNDDENNKLGTEKTRILEEIKQNPGINATKLQENLQENTSISTIKRRLKELKDAGKIKYEGSDRKGGYYIA